jgi:hypothetical protein
VRNGSFLQRGKRVLCLGLDSGSGPAGTQAAPHSQQQSPSLSLTGKTLTTDAGGLCQSTPVKAAIALCLLCARH